MKGGYKIIDFKDTNFTVGTAKTVAGIYGAIDATDKPILFENVSVGGTAQKNRFVTLHKSGTSYVGNFDETKSITITNASAITIATIS